MMNSFIYWRTRLFPKLSYLIFFYFNKSVRVSLINAIIYADKYKAHNDVSKKYYSGAP